jgi:hypothetical protein
LKIGWEGRTWEIDTAEVTLKQAMVIQARMGTSINGWAKALLEADGDKWLTAMECLYWLMLAQDGQQVPVADLDFPVLKYANAFADAQLSKDEAAPDAEPDPTSSAALNGAAEPVPGAVTG